MAFVYEQKAKSPGAARQLVTSLARPREVTKRRPPPLHRPLPGVTLCYSKSRAAAELALAKDTRGLRQSSPTTPGSSALLGGTEGEPLDAAYRWCNAARRIASNPIKSTASRHREFPSDPPSNAAEPGDVGEHCLSPRIAFAEGELRSRPARRVTQGTPEGGGAAGCPFFGDFLWACKESYQPAGAAPGEFGFDAALNCTFIRVGYKTKRRFTEGC